MVQPFIAYIPPAYKGNRITIDLTVLSGTGYAYWFDPTDGQFLAAQSSTITNQGNGNFLIPGKNKAGARDWVLLIQTQQLD